MIIKHNFITILAEVPDGVRDFKIVCLVKSISKLNNVV